MKSIKKVFVSGLVLMAMLVSGTSFLPAHASARVGSDCNKSGSFLGLPAWYTYLDVGPEDGDSCAITGPKDNEGNFSWQKALPLIGLAVLEILLRLAGLIGVIFVIYGGFNYITSQGEPDKTKSSRQTIINALVGIAISIVASAVVSFIANTFTS